MNKQTKIKGKVFVISGPSGSGKTTLLERLLGDRRLKSVLVKSISFTTRPIRPNEKEGRDYFFLSEREFKRKLRLKKILEWTHYLGYYYATPREFVERHLSQGRHIALCLDLRGALRIKKVYPRNAVTIFIMPPSVNALRKRIERRCNTEEKEINQRLKLARKELLAAREYDYCVVNRDLIRAVRGLKKIILKETSAR